MLGTPTIPPRSWPGSFQLGDPEEKLIFAFNHCLPWFQVDGSVDKRHGEQGKADPRGRRLLCLCSPWLAQPRRQREEGVVWCECGEDKHRNRHAAGKGCRNTLGLTAWGTNRDCQGLGAAAEKHSREQQTLWMKPTGEMELQGNCWD